VIKTPKIICNKNEYENGTGHLIETMMQAQIVVGELTAGTHQIADRVVVHRYTNQEFAAATVNRKLYLQIEMMRELNDRVIVVLEGCALETRSFIEPESLIDTLAWLTIDSGVQVVQADTMEHSAALIGTMARLCHNSPSYTMPLRHTALAPSVSVLTRYVLEGLPWLTSNTASILSKQFGSLHGLSNASMDELQRTPGIGHGLGRRLYALLREGKAQPQPLSTDQDPDFSESVVVTLQKDERPVAEVAESGRSLIEQELRASVELQRREITRLHRAIENMRTSGGKDEFQAAFDAAKDLVPRYQDYGKPAALS
jgi:ERCC4-type nuclease